MNTSVFTEEMIRTILDFQDTTPWNTLKEMDLFAIQFTDGNVGYCSVLGHGCSVCGMNYYEGDSGLASYFRSLKEPSGSILDQTDEITLNDSFNCFLTDDENVDDAGIKAIRKYLLSHKRKNDMPTLNPVFIRSKPGTWPGPISSKQEVRRSIEALQAATYMVKQVQASSLKQMGFGQEDEYLTEKGGDVVPMLIVRQGEEGYELSSMTLPEVDIAAYPTPLFENIALAQRLCELPPKGEYQCKFCYFPSPIAVDANGAPCFPDVMAMIELFGSRCDITMAQDIVPGDAQAMLEKFGEKFVEIGYRPISFIVADIKTRNFLTDFCRQCGIPIRVQEQVPLLEKAYGEFLNAIMR